MVLLDTETPGSSREINSEDAFGCFARADNGKMRAANESYALKMNIIVISFDNFTNVKSYKDLLFQSNCTGNRFPNETEYIKYVINYLNLKL